jgi:peroxiredoxin Q/BCP
MNKTSALFFPLLVMLGACFASAATPPPVGEMAPNFTLRTLDDRAVELNALTAKSPVVLVVLRGWPGYQCPLCTRQVHDFVARAAGFKEKGAQVLMVYPGPAGQLRAHAQDFLQDKSWPADFLFVVDPDYTFTNAYGLRWDAKNETAYPSTIVLARGGKVVSATISKTHGGRTSAAEVLAGLK